ncbi:putative cationic amino acid transporter [Caerostris extrusa]|uniref:Cationic amino acid transporter n=1 Tax=Caerostris extrusa TaxID=172846 RepID=A0AAV4MT23_CAEEX|nr:putative cationic amino acid transporter [Caerostris extrusa]
MCMLQWESYSPSLLDGGMILEYSVGTALAAKACSQYLDVVLDGQLSELLRQHLGGVNVKGLDTFLDVPSVAIMFIACIIFIGSFKSKYASVKVCCSLNNVFVVVNLLVICGTVVVGIFHMDSENWIAGLGFFPGGVTGIGQTVQARIEPLGKEN